MDDKIRARSFSGRFSHMHGPIWGWNVEKLEGGGSQILVPYHLHAVDLDIADMTQDLLT